MTPYRVDLEASLISKSIWFFLHHEVVPAGLQHAYEPQNQQNNDNGSYDSYTSIHNDAPSIWHKGDGT